MRSFTSHDRTGQVWLGVNLEDEGDVCLCVRTELMRSNVAFVRHWFVDLEVGIEFARHEMLDSDRIWGFDNLPHRRRLM